MSRPGHASLPPHVDVAGWLLGALDRDEAAAFETHLGACPECRAEVEQLRPAVDLLAGAAHDVTVPPQLAGRTIEAVRQAARTRIRRRWAVRGLAAAAAVVVALAVGTALLFAPARTHNINFSLAAPGGGSASGTASVHDTGHGWSIRLSVRGLALLGNSFYECWYVDPAKDSPGHPDRVSAGTFDVDPSGTATVQMWSSADPHDFPVMQIAREPLDGNPASNRVVVLSGAAKLH